tara:strand:- start:11321 stop:11869 length:549 start_codon:yes stop_codon:yes gene_type:complete
MLKNTLLAAVCVAGLSVVAPITMAYAAVDATELSADEQAALDAQVAVVEGFLATYENDPAGLEAAIKDYVLTSTNPVLNAKAVLVVFDNSQNPKVTATLKAAAGRGVGAAIVALGITNPEDAATITALVSGSDDQAMKDSAQEGANSETASINNQRRQNRANAGNDTTGDSTPEKDLSPTVI